MVDKSKSNPAVPNKQNRPRRRKPRTRRNARLGGELVDLGPNQTRSGKRSNPADPRTIHQLVELGNTVNGRRAALKILHPCGEHNTYVTKIPDGAASTSVALERRDEYNLTQQFGTDTSWTCVIVHLPFLVQTRIAIQWESSSSPDQSALQSALDHFLITQSAGDEPVYPTWDTVTLNSIVYYGSILQSSTVTPTVIASGPASLFRDIRRTAYGSTVDYDANTLTDAGRVVVGQWSADITLGTGEVKATVYTGASNGATSTTVSSTVVTDEFDIYRGVMPPLTSTEMVSNDLKIYQNEARCGSYTPLRNWQEDFLFTSANELRFVDISTNGVASSIAAASPTQDVWFRGWGMAVELYMSMNSTTSLRVKIREDLELVTTTGSPYAPFSTDGYSHDERSLKVVKEFARMEPHSYPSDFNSWNDMFKNIIGGIGSAVSNLGIPFISGLANPLANLVKGLI